MDAALFAQILSDKSVLDLRKLEYKYPDVDINELVGLFKTSVCKTLPIQGFNGSEAVYMESITLVRMNAVKLLLTPQGIAGSFGQRAMEDEIAATLTIENIDFNRDSVRRILQGYAPSDGQEHRIYGMKNGLEFIADPNNEITQENIHILYDITVGQYLDGEDKLNPGEFYRHDSVFVVGQQIEHAGLPHTKLPEYMKSLVAFSRQDSPMNDLLRAAAIHFYLAYLHPYFDGNGRMARLMHMWFLRRQGYSSALYVPFSSYIERSRKQYYNAYTLIEENAKISGILDITPFLEYFTRYVYNKLEDVTPRADASQKFTQALENGTITAKEKELWFFVLSAYGNGEFSTKQLERDFRNAAYATIRAFVIKFTELHLLSAQKYGNRVKYSCGLSP